MFSRAIKHMSYCIVQNNYFVISFSVHLATYAYFCAHVHGRLCYQILNELYLLTWIIHKLSHFVLIICIFIKKIKLLGGVWVQFLHEQHKGVFWEGLWIKNIGFNPYVCPQK